MWICTKGSRGHPFAACSPLFFCNEEGGRHGCSRRMEAYAEARVGGAEEAGQKDIAYTLTKGFILCIGRLVARRVSLAWDTNQYMDLL